MTSRIGISEARRRLPELVRRLAADGGRVDITHRGVALASLVRSAEPAEASAAQAALPAALRVELHVPSDELVGEVRALRARVGRPRTGPATSRR